MKKILALLGVCLFVAACFPRLPEPPVTLESVALPVVGNKAILWQSDDYKGKPMLVVFMGSWCPWCKKTMPAVTALKEKYGDQVEIVGAFMDGAPEPVAEAMKANGFTGKAIYDASEMAEGLGVQGLPHTILFNNKQQVVNVWEGYRPDMYEMVSEEIDKLVK